MKIRKVITTVIMTSILSINCVAANASGGANSFSRGNTTVTFTQNTNFSYDEQMLIADVIFENKMGVVSINPEEVQPASLTCTLFGHDLVSEYVYSTDHKVRSTQPRCKQSTYVIDTCSRCDYTDVERVGSEYIECCPND